MTGEARIECPSREKALEALVHQEDRDYQLWSITILTVIVLGAGFAALTLPELIWDSRSIAVQGGYLPQLMFGLVVLVALFNIYLIGQRRALSGMRQRLYEQLRRADEAETISFIDPMTSAFNRRYMDVLLEREALRADRSEREFSIAMIDLDDFHALNERFGHLEGDRCLAEVARLLMHNFRRSDTVVRYGGDEFVVVMPDTSETKAKIAVDRFLACLDSWNGASGWAYDLALSCGVATYTKGSSIQEVLARADRRMYASKCGETEPSASGTGSGDESAPAFPQGDERASRVTAAVAGRETLPGSP